MPIPRHPAYARWLTFFLAAGTSCLLYLHRYTWSFTSVGLEKDYSLAPEEITTVYTMFNVAYALGQIPSGILIDRLGPRACLLVSVAAWSTALCGMSLVSSVFGLCLLRLVFGLAQAGTYPALSRVTKAWFPAEYRTATQGWIATFFGRSGGALAPLVMAGFFMGTLGYSWSTALAILGGLGFVYVVILWKYMRNTPEGGAVVDLAVAGELATTDDRAAVAAREAVSFLDLLRNRSIWMLSITLFLVAGADNVYVQFLGDYFLNERELDLKQASWFASIPLWGGAVGGMFGGMLNDLLKTKFVSRRWARSLVGCTGCLVAAGLTTIIIQQPSVQAVGICLFGVKFFIDWCQPTVWGSVTDMGGNRTAALLSIVNTMGSLAGVLLPSVFSWIVTGGDGQEHRYGALFATLCGIYLAAGVCWLFVDCTKGPVRR